MTTLPQPIFRFAPSPSGYLHLGHAYSALFSWTQAQKNNAQFMLRIEDIDTTRCRKEFTEAIYEDLAWLGLTWVDPPRIQSEHMEDYQQALTKLENQGLLYPCFCTRKEIQQEVQQSGRAPHGPDGLIYPGTCRNLSATEKDERLARGDSYALRLDTTKACALTGDLFWKDQSKGKIKATPEIFGDVVLARKDIHTSYHLSVAVDDALQNISCVTRGTDLFEATHIHRLLQALLKLPVPTWHHHDLIHDKDGNRLAKRHNALAIRELRARGNSLEDIKKMAGV
ncbi:glutamyl-tRNA synthetase [Kiloniella litopenaei]|uniref:Glutamyl-tRNA synthetase n=1 Tax=Kiloniella litopenaei TaxID=1549748 RepID=A0A0M2RER4_9PROT|nr:tRNA glutamyl-Q(34) synthetase GluQRS [Kiloniella litopenaei]KKJ78063.1 glutamyl-tRNA synthetase [Kiloniella litopenaei]